MTDVQPSASADASPPPFRAAGAPAPTLTRAGVGVRLAAALVDAALLLPAYQLLRWAALEYWDKSGAWASYTAGNALVLAYTSWEFLLSGTPGKALLRLSIRSADGAPAPRGRRLGRWALKWGGRLCGLIDAATGVVLVRRGAEWLGLAIFRSEPLNFVTLRFLGELLVLASVAGFFFALGPTRLALYDRLTGTAVYRRPAGVGKRGFEPLMVLPVAPETT
jgi:hypothetical protein